VGGINAAGSIVFAASLDAGGSGIYTGSGSTTDKVITKGDPLFGSTVTSVQISTKAINDSGQIAFEATLADGRSVVVRADPSVAPVPDIAATSLNRDAAHGGVGYGYTISNADLPKPTTAALYWAPTSTFDPAQDTLIPGSVFTTATAAQSDPYTGHIDAATVGTPPPGAKDLLFVVDPSNVISPADPSKVASLALSSIVATTPTWNTTDGAVDYGYTISGADLPQATTFDLGWASGTAVDTVIGSPIISVTTATAQGTYSLQVPASDVANPPQGALYIVAVIDRNNLISPPDPSKAASLALADIAPTTLSYDPAGGVDFGYTISKVNLPQPTTAALYWAPDPTFDSREDTLAYSTPTETAQGTYPVTVDPSQLLATPPPGTAYLLAVADPDNAIVESYGVNNVQPVALFTPGLQFPVSLMRSPTIDLPPVQKGTSLPGVLQTIAFGITLNSYSATFTEQEPTDQDPDALCEAVASTGANPRTVSVSLLPPLGILPPVSVPLPFPISVAVTVTLFATAPAEAPPPDQVCTFATGATFGWLNCPYTPGDLVLNWKTTGFTSLGLNWTGPLDEWLDLGKEVPQDSALTPFDKIVYDAEQQIELKNQDIVFRKLLGQVATIFDPGHTDLLVKGPDGAQTGMAGGATVVEGIPLSVYFPSVPAVFIAQPQAGQYETQVTGVGSGGYELVTALVNPSRVVAQESDNGVLSDGQTAIYSAKLNADTGSLSLQSSTDLSAVSAIGTSHGTATFSARLRSGSSPLGGVTVAFTLQEAGRVASVGAATTNAIGVATLSGVGLANFRAGTYAGAVGARFAGDSVDASSSAIGDLTVAPAPVSTDGPRVTRLERFGYHWMPTTLVLTFSQALDPTSAQDPNDYRIVGPAGRTIRVKEAVYSPVARTVTLYPTQRINIHYTYELIVDGTAPGGLTNTEGTLLDGADSGKPGSDYRAPLTWRNLVLDPPAPQNPHKATSTTRPAEIKSEPARGVTTQKAALFTRTLLPRR
jgi:hypothetical protein